MYKFDSLFLNSFLLAKMESENLLITIDILLLVVDIYLHYAH